MTVLSRAQRVAARYLASAGPRIHEDARGYLIEGPSGRAHSVSIRCHTKPCAEGVLDVLNNPSLSEAERSHAIGDILRKES